MPRSSREKSAETRTHIVDTAYQLFVERGYSATSMRDIGQGAEVTVGAIYNHFQTKEEIWKEVLLTKHPYHEIFPLLLSAQGETVAEVVRASARAMVQELFKRPDLFNLLFIELVEFKGKHVPDVFEAIFPEVAALQSIFKGKRGQMRSIPGPILLRSFVGLFFSYYITGMLMKDLPGVSIDEASLDRFVDLYLYGILEDEAPDREEA
jgi:AcrR family transcriptional regulator